MRSFSASHSTQSAGNITPEPMVTGEDTARLNRIRRPDPESDGQDVTPAGLAPVVIVVPPAAPVITSVTLERNGTTLTVIVLGYSTTRDMTSADFTFSPASGDTISDPQLAVDLGTSFTGWYGQADSILYGSAFTYTQNFTLNNAATTIGSVSVKLTNSIGTSAAGTAN